MKREKKNEQNSGRSYKMTPCKRTFGTKNRKALECMILTILLFCFNNGDAGVLQCLARFSLEGFFSFFISIDYSSSQKKLAGIKSVDELPYHTQHDALLIAFQPPLKAIDCF